MFKITDGLGLFSKSLVLNRLELPNSLVINKTSVSSFPNNFNRELTGFLNRFYSQVASVNSFIGPLVRFNVIRLYLIKSYRGRCHAIGKPVRGQRTWSNAWTSYKFNKVLRQFLSEMKFKLKKNVIKEKINFKITGAYRLFK